MRRKNATLAGILLLSTLFILATSLSMKARVNLQSQANVQPIGVTIKQLPAEDEKPAVELRSAKAFSSNPDTLNELTCIIKNNHNKAITAYSVVIKVTSETDGKQSSHTELFMTDSFLHQDVQEIRKLRPIASGSESSAEIAGLTKYDPNSRVTGAEIYLDYVEFEDKTFLTAPVNINSADRINKTREGASRYKDWLRQQYTQSGKSLSLVASLLQDRALPQSLGLNSANLRQGAQMYRKAMLDLHANEGPKAVETYLNR